MRRVVISFVASVLTPILCLAHDTWLQPNINLIRTGDAVHIDLMLGNHGNDHRDFKLAGKVSPEFIQAFEVIAPDGKKYDLKSDLVDLGYAPKEGFFTSRFVTGKPGLHIAHQKSDRILNFGKPFRSVHSSKTYFMVSNSLDKVYLISGSPATAPIFLRNWRS